MEAKTAIATRTLPTLEVEDSAVEGPTFLVRESLDSPGDEGRDTNLLFSFRQAQSKPGQIRNSTGGGKPSRPTAGTAVLGLGRRHFVLRPGLKVAGIMAFVQLARWLAINTVDHAAALHTGPRQ